MMLAIPAIIYITILCRIYGLMIISAPQAARISWFLPAFAGLGLLGICYMGLSIVMPLDGWIPQLLVGLVPLIAILARPSMRKELFRLRLYPGVVKAFDAHTDRIHPLIWAMAIVSAILLLLMFSSPVTHPDTLTYHGQNIEWMARYAAIKGVANLQYHYGLQSSWFSLCALFRFGLGGDACLGFVNVTVMCWVVAFILLELNKFNRQFVPWLMLLVLAGWSYTQLRLTVTSASPDFIAAIFCWLAFYVFAIRADLSRPVYQSLLTLFVAAAISTKLSVMPIGLLIVGDAFRQRGTFTIASRVKSLIASGLWLLASLSPVLVRNIITTGYPFYPASTGDMNLSYKVPSAWMSIGTDYIRAFARTRVPYDLPAIAQSVDAAAMDWIPLWWLQRSVADQALLIFMAMMIIGVSVVFRQIPKRSLNVSGLILLVSLVGCCWWFVLAPDPRFGYGFLVPATGTLLMMLMSASRGNVPVVAGFIPTRRIMLFIMAGVTGIILLYTGYRFKSFFTASQLLTPAGPVAQPRRVIKCNGVTMLQALPDGTCGSSDIPCIYNCNNWQLMGDSFQDGIRPKP